MNIFILDEDPAIAAQMQCNKHIVKMPLEVAQMLSTINGGPYKITHEKHPCTLWAKASISNYKWLVSHGIALCKEYTSRYGREHKSEEIIMALSDPVVKIPLGGLTPFALAMPDILKQDNAVEAYKAYYKSKMLEIDMIWPENKMPNWIIKEN